MIAPQGRRDQQIDRQSRRVWTAIIVIGVFVLVGSLMLAIRPREIREPNAKANLQNIKPGMQMFEVAQKISPVVAKAYPQSLAVRTGDDRDGKQSTLHDLGDGEHVAFFWKPRKAGMIDRLDHYEIRPGPAPREDLTYGRHLNLGGIKVRY